jgi:hypothetical protein
MYNGVYGQSAEVQRSTNRQRTGTGERAVGVAGLSQYSALCSVDDIVQIAWSAITLSLGLCILCLFLGSRLDIHGTMLGVKVVNWEPEYRLNGVVSKPSVQAFDLRKGQPR